MVSGVAMIFSLRGSLFRFALETKESGTARFESKYISAPESFISELELISSIRKEIYFSFSFITSGPFTPRRLAESIAWRWMMRCSACKYLGTKKRPELSVFPTCSMEKASRCWETCGSGCRARGTEGYTWFCPESA